MANQRSKMGLILIVCTAMWAGVVAQSNNDCTNVLISMSPCLNYITGNSSVPSSGCCTQLSSVVSNKPECLCQILNGGGSNLGLNINQTQALALPTACKVETPPVSRYKRRIRIEQRGVCAGSPHYNFKEPVTRSFCRPVRIVI